MEPVGLERLLRRARQHDPDALQELFDAYQRRVYGLVLRLTGSRHTAEDLVQETFLRVVRRIGDYQHSGKFEAWLFRIAANLARDHARRRARRPVFSLGDEEARRGEPSAPRVPDPRTNHPEHGIGLDEASRRLHGCLSKLGETDREIILLRHFSELPFGEIAELLEIPLGTALARAHRAMKRLKCELGEP